MVVYPCIVYVLMVSCVCVVHICLASLHMSPARFSKRASMHSGPTGDIAHASQPSKGLPLKGIAHAVRAHAHAHTQGQTYSLAAVKLQVNS